MAGNAPDPKMDANDLYREDTITDRKVGTIRVLTPVRPDGSTDPARNAVYVGQAQIMTPAGVLPLSFEIPAATLAVAKEAATLPGLEADAKKAADEIRGKLEPVPAAPPAP